MDFSYKMKKLRVANGLTQKQLADSLNVSQNAVYNWENGKREPRIDMIKKIAKVFDFPLYLLLDDNFELENVEFEMKRARPVNSYEMAEPPKPFTFPLSSHNNYDGSIRIKTDSEREKLDDEAQKILMKQATGEKNTKEESHTVSDYIKRTQGDYDKLSESIKNLTKVIGRYLNENTQMPDEIVQDLKESLQKLIELTSTMPDFYENLNDIGRKKAADYISDLSNIPEYQKEPPDPTQE